MSKRFMMAADGKRLLFSKEDNNYFGGYERRKDGTLIKIKDDERCITDKMIKKQEERRRLLKESLILDDNQLPDGYRIIEATKCSTVEHFLKCKQVGELAYEDKEHMIFLPGMSNVSFSSDCCIGYVDNVGTFSRVQFDLKKKVIYVWLEKFGNQQNGWEKAKCVYKIVGGIKDNEQNNIGENKEANTSLAIVK